MIGQNNSEKVKCHCFASEGIQSGTNQYCCQKCPKKNGSFRNRDLVLAKISHINCVAVGEESTG
jgi:hypothetical protein